MKQIARTLLSLGSLCGCSLLPACSGGDEPGASGAALSTGGQTFGTGGQTTSTGGQTIGTGGQATGTGGTQASSGGQVGSGGSTNGPRGSSVSFDGTRIEAKIIARSVAPGSEQHVCVVVELPNETGVWVDKIDATLTGGSHHLIVDRPLPGTGLQLEPQPCSPTMASDVTRLMIAQQPTTNITLPSGAAFSIAARQPLFMQLHYFNSGSAVRDITGTVQLTLADTSSSTPTEAKSLFTGTMNIQLDPQSAGRAQAWFVPVPERGVRHIFALTSHTHHLGVDSTIERVPNETAAPTTPIHESTSWDEPPLTGFSPTLDFTGSDGLRLVCNYQNTTSQTVFFGTGVDAEMCFMWVYYFDR